MTDRDQSDDLERLTDDTARRLLARASELEAAGPSVAELRDAAREAGIEPRAFEQALAELRAGAPSLAAAADAPPSPGRLARAWSGARTTAQLVGALGAVIVLGAFLTRL